MQETKERESTCIIFLNTNITETTDPLQIQDDRTPVDSMSSSWVLNMKQGSLNVEEPGIDLKATQVKPRLLIQATQAKPEMFHFFFILHS